MCIVPSEKTWLLLLFLCNINDFFKTILCLLEKDHKPPELAGGMLLYRRKKITQASGMMELAGCYSLFRYRQQRSFELYAHYLAVLHLFRNELHTWVRIVQ